MTKEEIYELISDEGFQERMRDFVEYMGSSVLGSDDFRVVSLIEVLISIKDALWTIADNVYHER